MLAHHILLATLNWQQWRRTVMYDERCRQFPSKRDAPSCSTLHTNYKEPLYRGIWPPNLLYIQLTRTFHLVFCMNHADCCVMCANHCPTAWHIGLALRRSQACAQISLLILGAGIMNGYHNKWCKDGRWVNFWNTLYIIYKLRQWTVYKIIFVSCNKSCKRTKQGSNKVIDR